MAFDGFKDLIVAEYPELEIAEGALEEFSDDLECAALDWMRKHRKDYSDPDRVGATCVYAILDELDSVLDDSSVEDPSSVDDGVIIELTNRQTVTISGKMYDAAFAGYPTWYKCLWEAVSDRELTREQAADLSSKQIVKYWQSCL